MGGAPIRERRTVKVPIPYINQGQLPSDGVNGGVELKTAEGHLCEKGAIVRKTSSN